MSDAELTQEEKEWFWAHLRARGLDRDLPGVVIDDVSGRVSFLLYDLSGRLIGVQKYNPFSDQKNNGGRYKTYVAKCPCGQQHIAVWGLQFYRTDLPFVFLTEGIFDAIRIINAGWPAIALLSCDIPRTTRTWLKTLPQIRVAILDTDKAGKKMSRYGDRSFVVPSPYKDLGDMPAQPAQDYINRLIRENNT